MQDYTHEQAVVDGVNVGYDVYRIETEITKTGRQLVESRASSCRTATAAPSARSRRKLDDDLTYTANQLDRDVVVRRPDPTRHPHLPRQAAPRSSPAAPRCPKTLVFAKTDQHAEDIVRIVREEFGKGNDFCQKITYQEHRRRRRRTAQPASATRTTRASPSPWT